MMIHVYGLKSLRYNRIYVGQTENVEKRLKQHNNGAVKTTKYYKPWKLIYTKACVDRKEARLLEKHLKSGRGKRFLMGFISP